MADPWYFVQIPSLPEDVSDVQIEDYNDVCEHLRAVAMSGCGYIPDTFKERMRWYMTRWHPEVELPKEDS